MWEIAFTGGAVLAQPWQEPCQQIKRGEGIWALLSPRTQPEDVYSGRQPFPAPAYAPGQAQAGEGAGPTLAKNLGRRTIRPVPPPRPRHLVQQKVNILPPARLAPAPPRVEVDHAVAYPAQGLRQSLPTPADIASEPPSRKPPVPSSREAVKDQSFDGLLDFAQTVDWSTALVDAAHSQNIEGQPFDHQGRFCRDQINLLQVSPLVDEDVLLSPQHREHHQADIFAPSTQSESAEEILNGIIEMDEEERDEFFASLSPRSCEALTALAHHVPASVEPEQVSEAAGEGETDVPGPLKRKLEHLTELLGLEKASKPLDASLPVLPSSPSSSSSQKASGEPTEVACTHTRDARCCLLAILTPDYSRTGWRSAVKLISPGRGSLPKRSSLPSGSTYGAAAGRGEGRKSWDGFTRQPRPKTQPSSPQSRPTSASTFVGKQAGVEGATQISKIRMQLQMLELQKKVRSSECRGREGGRGGIARNNAMKRLGAKGLVVCITAAGSAAEDGCQ
jgi:hypothetical protein